MSKIEWKEALRTGIEDIDLQHRELIKRIDSLDIAIYEGRGRGELVRTMEYLGTYVEEHFRAEEDLMRKIDYPDLPRHIEEHRKFEMKFNTMKKEYVTKGANSVLALELDREVVKWFEHHLLESDMKYVGFMKKKQ